MDNFKPYFNCCKVAASLLGWKPSREMRKRNSESQKGKKASPETRAKQSAAHKGKKKSEEWKRKIGDANRGKKHSKASKRKLSAARLGHKLNLTPEERERRREQFRLNTGRGRKKAS